MANTSVTHIIVDKTIAVALVAERTFATQLKCAWFAVRNNSATKTLYLKTSDTNTTADAIPILPGDYYRLPNSITAYNGFDLSDYRFYSDTVGHSFTVEYFKG